MPEMDGFECTAIIRDKERPAGGRLPIIATTAYATQDDQARCLAAGMDAYLSKPFKPVELFELVAISSTACFSPAIAARLGLSQVRQRTGNIG